MVATRDWHPPDHGSFREQGGPWPPHCVQGTHGAELHDSLDRDKVDAWSTPARSPNSRATRFEETDLAEVLAKHDVDEVTVAGLATDYCVQDTALDALREGFRVTVDRGGIRGIDVSDGDSERALEELRAAGADRS